MYLYYSDEVSSESSDLESDTPSPPYSPLSPTPISTSTSSSLSGELDDSDNVPVPSDITDASDAFHGQEGFLPISDSGHQAMSQLHPLDSERPTRLFYKIVGDNIDKNVRPSFQRMDMTTRSLHYFHSYTVQDRINTTDMSGEPNKQLTSAESLLPTAAELEKVLGDFKVLVSR